MGFHRLCICQSADHHAPDAPRLWPPLPAGEARSAVRCVAQLLQAAGASLCGARAQPVCPPKGSNTRLWPWPSRLPTALRNIGQPVLIGGSMGTRSAIMAGAGDGAERAFASACHGAGRQLSRHQALRRWYGRQVVDDPATIGIIVRSPSSCGIAEEAPGAYKDIGAVVDAAHATGLARKVAMMAPVVCIKGQPRPQRGRQ